MTKYGRVGRRKIAKKVDANVEWGEKRTVQKLRSSSSLSVETIINLTDVEEYKEYKEKRPKSMR